MDALIYQDAVEALLDAVPELRPAYAKELEAWKEDKPGAYIVFEDLVHEFLIPLLRSDGGDEALRRLFALFERMSQSQDQEVVNLVQVAEMEFLVGQPDLLSQAWKYMGPATRALARDTAKIWKCEKNLPQAG